MRINSRVLGTSGLELPPDFEGEQIQTEFSRMEKTILTHAMLITTLSTFQGDACYACPTNKEQNSIQAAIFQKHIQATHPNVTCDEMPRNIL